MRRAYRIHCLTLAAAALLLVACNLQVAPPVGVATRYARQTEQSGGASAPTESSGLSSTATALAAQFTTAAAPTAIQLQSRTPQISGLIWHDSCSGDSACNGALDAGEIGIAGVQVALYSGACPPPADAATHAEQTTRDDGAYQFTGLDETRYCLQIRDSSPANLLLLAPGMWTALPDGAQTVNGAVQVTATAGSGDTRWNFGWDFAARP